MSSAVWLAYEGFGLALRAAVSMPACGVTAAMASTAAAKPSSPTQQFFHSHRRSNAWINQTLSPAVSTSTASQPVRAACLMASAATRAGSFSYPFS